MRHLWTSTVNFSNESPKFPKYFCPSSAIRSKLAEWISNIALPNISQNISQIFNKYLSKYLSKLITNFAPLKYFSKHLHTILHWPGDWDVRVKFFQIGWIKFLSKCMCPNCNVFVPMYLSKFSQLFYSQELEIGMSEWSFLKLGG